MSKSVIWCLHGQLQTPRVWEQFQGKFGSGAAEFDLATPSLWDSAAIDFWSWADEFCNQVERSESPVRYLLGYSLGGRLALHALIKRPDLWSGVILIGAQTGLTQEIERRATLARDRRWAERFVSEDWNRLLSEWDAIDIFGGRPAPLRIAAGEISTEHVAWSFDALSAGRQEDLLGRVANLEELPPLLYLAGSEDVNYHRCGSALASRNPKRIAFKTISNSAHRAPWDNPIEFCDVVNEFLARTRRPVG